MSKPASKTLIGVFVLGALALAVIALVIFGSGKFFERRITYVMYFDGSVKGLNIGSPVVFRGVKIGSVKDIELKADVKDFKALHSCICAGGATEGNSHEREHLDRDSILRSL